MRSGSLAWLLETAGFKCTALTGGYKAFRRFVLAQFKKRYPFIVLGGLTGSGKTELLQRLAGEGEQVVDLEKLANHHGSSFGNLAQREQPSNEHFENQLAVALFRLEGRSPIWIEDESRMIGHCCVPKEIWEQMRLSLFFWIDSPKEERIKRLLSLYGIYAEEAMIEAAERLAKKLGGERTKQVIRAIQDKKLEEAISKVLDYYDQAYLHSCAKRERSWSQKFSLFDAHLIDKLMSHVM
jgi:tRNA 2-selenouridine synthase